MIVNAGIRRVVYRHGYPDDFAVEMLREGGVLLERFEDDGDDANDSANNEENRKENTEE